MLPQFYKFSHGFCLNNFLQVWFIGDQIYQVPPFRYINQTDEMYRLVRGRTVLGGMKYLIRSVKRSAGAVGIWTKDN